MSAEENVSMLLGEPRKAIRTMALPLLLALLVTEVNSFADRAWCSGLGTDALAAVAIGAPVYFVITGLGLGLGVGGTATLARHIGSGRRDRAEGCALQALMFGLILGLVLTPILVFLCEDIMVLAGAGDVAPVASDYMIWLMAGTPILVINGVISGLIRGEGAAKVSTIMMAAMAVTNIVLDPLLIYVLDLGIAGASIATVIATVVSTLVGLMFYHGHSLIRIRRSGFHWDRERLSDVLFVGVPQMAEYTVMYSMNLVLNYLVIWCAGSEGLAVYSVPNLIVNLALLPAYAVGSALVPVASAALGQGDRWKMRDSFHYSLWFAALLAVAISAVLILIPEPMLYPFTYSESTSYLTSDMAEALRIISLCLPFYSVIPVSASFLQAMGRSDWSLVCAVVRNLVYIALYALGAMVSLYWIYWAVVVGSVIGGAMIYSVAVRGYSRMRPGTIASR